jgi:hypothetical protein
MEWEIFTYQVDGLVLAQNFPACLYRKSKHVTGLLYCKPESLVFPASPNTPRVLFSVNQRATLVFIVSKYVTAPLYCKPETLLMVFTASPNTPRVLFSVNQRP